MLDTYQLQVFLAVVEAGSYTAAARRLHLTQPAVSRQIRLLQEQLGVALFRRVGRKTLPTHAGERLLQIARQVLDLSRRVEEEMAFLRGEVAGALRLGGSGAPAWHVLGRLLATFRAGRPGVGFHLELLPPEGARPALRTGRVDVVLVEEEIRERGLACDLLVEMETVLVAPLADQWLGRKRLPLRKLADIPLILPAPGTPARCFLEQSMAEREIVLSAPPHALEVSEPGMAVPLVAAGMGTALLPRALLGGSREPVHGVVLWPGLSWPIYLVRRASPASRLEQLFCEFVLGEGRALLR